MKKANEYSPIARALRTFFIIIALVFLYAYAVDVTRINLEEPQEPQRQETTIRVIRLLARPDFFAYNEETRSKHIGIRIPCDGSDDAFEYAGDQQIILDPGCANTTQDKITVTGTNFHPFTNGILRWHAPGDVQTTRALTTFRTDGDGSFTAEFTMPDIRPTEELQRIEIEEKWRSGGFLGTGIVGLSEASRVTFEKIVETILLAFMATTIGTLIAIPVSFLAARNLMVDVFAPLAAIGSAVVMFPIGSFLGKTLTQFIVDIAGKLTENTPLGAGILIILILAIWALLKFGSRLFIGDLDSLAQKISSVVYAGLLLVLTALTIGILANFGITAGNWWDAQYSHVNWLVPLIELSIDAGLFGRFIALLSEFTLLMSPTIIGFILALITMSFGSRYGQELILKLDDIPARIFSVVMSSLGAFVLVYGIGSALDWLYQFDNPTWWTLYPGLVVGIGVGIVASLVNAKYPFPIGLVIYTSIRGVLNMVRSIEPLVYVIAFAVWVGIGPFAGVLALSLHTVAALGKLFSEQVENIAEGPIEAITATGANRLQTIVFAVVPQIIPPYIAFTFYRWDINVRVSTIIGFGGGGGIGFVLLQNINLLRYRQASVMMIAIAVVVMILDYVSSRIRSRII